MKNWIKEHVDTLTIVASIVGATWLIKSDIHEVDRRLTNQIHHIDAKLTGEMHCMDGKFTNELRSIDNRLTKVEMRLEVLERTFGLFYAGKFTPLEKQEE